MWGGGKCVCGAWRMCVCVCVEGALGEPGGLGRLDVNLDLIKVGV